MLGQLLLHYRVVEKIGEGGQGTVYKAIDQKLGRTVVLKVLPAELTVREANLKRFEREAQLASALDHPNICTIFDMDEANGLHFIAMQYVDGKNVRQLCNGRPLELDSALRIGIQVADALAAAHVRGIIHRDIKSGNVMVTDAGQVKILDFGLAKLTGPDSSQPQTEVPTRRVNTDPGMVMGTIGYMSPEQVRGKPADHRSDIFSFGAILYEMLSGRRAFRGESTADTISAILREDPPDLSGTNPGINPALERVVNHCLEKNPEERFHSARDLAFAVEALSANAGTSTSAATVLRSLPAAKRKTRELIAWSMAGLFLITAIVLAWFFLRRPAVVEPTISFVVAMPKDAVEVSSPVISPDGRSLAFVVTSRGKRSLYLRSLASTEAHPLPGTDDANSPFWSPDSRFIGFFTTNKLKKIDTGGGPAQTLCDASNNYGGTWNADGIILISLDTKGINRVSADGGTPTPVIPLDESRKELAQAWPHDMEGAAELESLAIVQQTRERTEHATNERMVARVVELAELCERPIATPAQTRALLGLSA